MDAGWHSPPARKPPAWDENDMKQSFRSRVSLAVAESRRSRGKLIFSLMSIVLGVSAITAVKTFTRSLEESILRESRSLMGADIRLASNHPFARDEPLTRELEKAGSPGAETTEFYTMARILRNGAARTGTNTRLVRIRAIRGPFPFYGKIESNPVPAYAELITGKEPAILLDPALLRSLDAVPGDAIVIGTKKFVVRGVVTKEVGGGSEFAAGYAPPVFLHADYLAQTGLLVTGSRIRYSRFFTIPPTFDAENWKESRWQAAQNSGITIVTYREAAANVRRFMTILSRFLTLSGLIILLLGGLGIGLAMNVFVKSKVDNVAIERALGATPNQTFQVYLLLALGLGAAGSAIGAILGYSASIIASIYGAEYFPVEVHVRFDPLTSFQTMALGLLTTLVFILRPIYQVRNVSPLRVLRRDMAERGALPLTGERSSMAATLLRSPVEAVSWVIAHPGETIMAGLVVLFMLLTASTESDSFMTGAAFTGGVLAAVFLLWLLSRIIITAAAKILPYIQSYRLRQGMASLFRPGNQTSVMVVAVGTGVFLVSTLILLRTSLEHELDFTRTGRPGLFLIDIQENQRAGVMKLVEKPPAEKARLVPMISMRVSAINGTAIDRSDVEKDAVKRNWQNSLRSNEYFASFRNNLIPSEKVSRGNFWNGKPAEQEVSIDDGWADRMEVKVGDKMTFDIQGLPLEARVTSLRKIDWAAAQLNSVLLFSPGEIEFAPRMYVASLSIPGEKERGAFQDTLVRLFPNVAVIDARQAVESVREIVERIAKIIRAMTGLTILAGAVILAGALGAGRFARIREAMLYKTIGAGKGDIRAMLFLEYAILGFLGGLAGMILAHLVVPPLLVSFFQAEVVFRPVPMIIVLAVVSILTVAIGMFVSRDVAIHKPLEILREETS